ncbi:LLM class flavin-dependent oxidoreductase [Streptomyces massasporeus]
MEWTGARYADQPTVEVTTWVAAPPGRVWALVSDVTRMPEMSVELQSARWAEGASGPWEPASSYSRQGWADVAAEVRRRWQAGDRDGAARLVTDEMVLATTLIGTEEMVRRRLRVWRDAGVDTVRLYPAGETLDDRLDTLGRAIELVHET